MNLSSNLLCLCLLLLFGSLSSADYINEEHYDPKCRDLRTFPFVSCEPQCTTYSIQLQQQCQANQQFGCRFKRCSAQKFQCALHPATLSRNRCPNGEAQVRQVSLKPNSPVEFNLAVNLKGIALVVLLLIDASESTKPRLDAVKNELSSFVRQLDGSAHVGVAVFGGEDAFNETGMRILSPPKENVEAVLNALESIPTYPDGPRTTLTALSSVQRYSQQLFPRHWRKTVVLIGDTPGREPECYQQMGRNEVSRSLFDDSPSVTLSYGISVIPASLGEPGLDAALPPIQPCSNRNIPAERRPVASGQASKIAEKTKGEVVTSISASGMFEAVDRVRRKSLVFYQSEPGAKISISMQSIVSHGIYYHPNMEPSINGCEDKVIVNMTGISSFVSEPAQITGKVKLELPDGICQSGPFSCKIRIKDRVIGQESLSHWIFPPTYYKDITVRAC